MGENMVSKRFLVDLFISIIILDLFLLEKKIIYLMYFMILTCFYILNYIKEFNTNFLKICVYMIACLVFFINFNFYEKSIEIFKGENEVIGILCYGDVLNKKNPILKVRKKLKIINVSILDVDGLSEYEDGDILKIVYKSKDETKVRNKGGFDFYRYNLSKGNVLIIDKIISSEIVGKNLLYRLRKNIIINLCNRLKNVGENFYLLSSSVLFGIYEDNEEYRMIKNELIKTSIIHFFTVSGFHFAIIYSLIYYFLKYFKIEYHIRILFIIFFMLLYWLITGMKFSSFRALFAIYILIFARANFRKFDFFSAVSLISIISMFANPYIIYNFSFFLTVLACLGISILYKEFIFLDRGKWYNKFIKGIYLTLSIQFIFLIYYIKFGVDIFYFSLIYNLFVGFFVVLFFYISLFVEFFSKLYLIKVYIPIEFISKCFIEFNRLISKFDVFFINISAFYMLFYSIFFIVILSYLSQNYYEMKFIDLKKILVILIVFSILISFSKNELKIYFFDVGEGDASLIITPNGKTILIDSGNGKIRLDYIIRRLYINKIDYLILSHEHYDHIGGAIELSKNLKVKNIIYSIGNDIEKYIVTDANYYRLSGKNTLNVDGVILNFQTSSIRKLNNVNNNSLVIRMKYKNLDVLYTGDIEEEVEKLFLKNNLISNIDVLKVAHHGSNTSSIQEILAKMNAKVSIIQVGKNSYGHPSSEVLNRLKNTKIFRNDKSGMIILKYDGKKKLIVNTFLR